MLVSHDDRGQASTNLGLQLRLAEEKARAYQVALDADQVPECLGTRLSRLNEPLSLA